MATSERAQRVKQAVNDVLRKTTGYQLQKPEPEAPPQPPAKKVPGKKAAAKKAPATKAAQQAPAKKAAAPAPEAPRAEPPKPADPLRGIPKHFDDDARELIARVRPRTMTGPIKLYGLIQSVRHLQRAGVPGEIVECGVWRGGSMQAVAWTLQAEGATDRNLHLFDTFEGMPPPTEEDRRAGDGKSAQDLLDATGKDAKVWAYADLDDVRTGMEETGYPAERVHYHPGMVEDTLGDNAPEQIALLRLDTDWYASTKHEFEVLYPRLQPGGVLIIDDYGHWEGSRKATEEFLAELDENLLLLPLASGRIAIKPA